MLAAGTLTTATMMLVDGRSGDVSVAVTTSAIEPVQCRQRRPATMQLHTMHFHMLRGC